MPAPRNGLKTIANGILVLLFLIGTALPILVNFSGWKDAAQLQEKRRLAAEPKWSWSPEALTEYPHQIDAYYADHFGLRSQLIRWHSIALLEGLGISPQSDVLAGRDGWLYLRNYKTIDDYRGLCPFAQAELEAWKRCLEERQQWLAARGIAYLFVLAPNKHSIYPEFLPGNLKRVRPQCRADQFFEYLLAHSTVPLLDLRAPLLQAKSRERLYHLTDTHWNGRGAFVAYQQLLGALARWFPSVQPLPRSAFSDVNGQKGAGDLADMVGLSDRLQEEWLGLSPLIPRQAQRRPVSIQTPPDTAQWRRPFAMECRGGGPRAVMFCDSFALSLWPLLSEHFQRIAYLWQYNFDPDAIEREHPQVVIEELVERMFIEPTLASNPPSLSAPTPSAALNP